MGEYAMSSSASIDTASIWRSNITRRTGSIFVHRRWGAAATGASVGKLNLTIIDADDAAT